MEGSRGVCCNEPRTNLTAVSASAKRGQSHEADTSPTVYYRTAIAPPSPPTQHQHNTNMGIRDSLSGLKGKIKLKLPGKKRKPHDTGTGTDGEGDGPAISLLQPVYGVADSGHDGRGGGPNPGGRQASLTDLLLRQDKPESASNDQEGGTDVDGGEVSQKCSDPRCDVEAKVESGHSREGDGASGETSERVSHSPSTPPILHGRGSDGMRT